MIGGSTNQWTRKALLAHYENQGRIARVSSGRLRGRSARQHAGERPGGPVSRGLAVGAGCGAGVPHGSVVSWTAHSVAERFVFLTATRSRPLAFRSWQFRPISFTKALCRAHQEFFAVQETERSGLPVRVTTLERTLVDVLDRPDLGGGWEEICFARAPWSSST